MESGIGWGVDSQQWWEFGTTHRWEMGNWLSHPPQKKKQVEDGMLSPHQETPAALPTSAASVS